MKFEPFATEPAPSRSIDVTEKSGDERALAASVVVAIRAGVMLESMKITTSKMLEPILEFDLPIVCTCLFVSLYGNVLALLVHL